MTPCLAPHTQTEEIVNQIIEAYIPLPGSSLRVDEPWSPAEMAVLDSKQVFVPSRCPQCKEYPGFCSADYCTKCRRHTETVTADEYALDMEKLARKQFGPLAAAWYDARANTCYVAFPFAFKVHIFKGIDSDLENGFTAAFSDAEDCWAELGGAHIAAL